MLYDAIVLGLGAMGSAAAAHLAGRGLRTLGVERYGPAHDRGSSHGESRMIRKAYFEHPAYVPLLQRAYELWRDLEQETGLDLLTVTGGLLVGSEQSATVAGGRASAERWDLPHRMLSRQELRAEFPTFVPPEWAVGLWEPEAGFVRPESAVGAHLRVAEARGAELRFGEEVLGWAVGEGGDGVEVRTSSGTVRAERLVACPGAWAPEVLTSLGLPLWVERQVLYWFEPTGPVDPFLLGRHPVWIYETADPEVQLYGFPALERSGGAKVAFFHGGAACTPWTIERQVGGEEAAAVSDALRELLPALSGGRLLRAVTCMYTNAPDRHFVIGALPGVPEVLVACGFSGHGFKFATVVGELLADMATGVPRPDVPAELFNPARATAAANPPPPGGG